jgi:hypothetical protein
MSSHGQTLTWGTHIGRSTRGTRSHWFQRLRQWFTRRPAGSTAARPTSVYAGWDGRREQCQPPRAESAFEHAAARGGQSWFITLYSAAL